MKKLYIIGIMMAFVVCLSSLESKDIAIAPTKTLKSTGPHGCYSGEPPYNISCANESCHGDNAENTGSAFVSLDLGDNNEGYELNKNYTISINIKKANMLRAGFQIIAVQDDSIDYSPGTIILNNAAETQKESSTTQCDAKFKTWVEHTYSGTDVDETGSKTWTITWKAPSKSAGNVTFYLSALEANDDQDNTGDYTYTLNKTMAFKQTVGIVDALLNNNLTIFPNPSTNELTIKYNNEVTLSGLEILNQAGTVLKSYKISRFNQTVSGTQTFDIHDLAAGVYFLKAHSEQGSIIKKVVILK